VCKKILTIFIFHGFFSILFSTIVFEDNFEDYPTGTFPNSKGWKLVYNGLGNKYQKIVNNTSSTTGKSLQLKGKTNWSANVIKKLQKTPNDIWLQVKMKAKKESESVMNYEISSAGFYNQDACKWGFIYAGVKFNYDGFIYFGEVNTQYGVVTKVIPWEENRWYTILIRYNQEGRFASLWIDDQPVVKNLPLPKVTIPYNSILLKGGNDTKTCSNFDDVIVYTKPIPKKKVLKLLLEGEKLYADKNYYPALSKFLQVFFLEPGNLRNLGNMSICSIKLERNDLARMAAFHILTLTKDKNHMASAYFNIALSFQREGKLLEATEYYKKNYKITKEKFVKKTLDKLSKTLFFDNFDGYKVGTFPYSKGWKMPYYGQGGEYQKITDITYVSKNNSLQLKGSPGYSVYANMNLDRRPKIVYMELAVKTKKEKASEYKYNETVFGFHNQQAQPYGYFYAGLKFCYDDYIYFGSSNSDMANVRVMRWESNRWYKIKIKYNKEKNLGSLWIDNELKVRNVVFDDSPLSYTGISLQGGNDTYTCTNFDDIIVYEE